MKEELLIELLKVTGRCAPVRVFVKGQEPIEGYIDHVNDGLWVWINKEYRTNGRYWQVALKSIEHVVEI